MFEWLGPRTVEDFREFLVVILYFHESVGVTIFPGAIPDEGFARVVSVIVKVFLTECFAELVDDAVLSVTVSVERFTIRALGSVESKAAV